MTLEAETERRLTVRHAHLELGSQLSLARDRLWPARIAEREKYESALATYLAASDDPDRFEALLVATGRLLAAERLLEDVSQRREENKNKAVR